jgi:AcrR family transcriptional regulator
VSTDEAAPQPQPEPQQQPEPGADTDEAEGRRARILTAAAELFAARGYDATPTSQIADQAGVPKGLLFYYFPRKRDILTTLLEERIPETPGLDAAEAVVPGDPAASLVRLAELVGLSRHESVVLRTILFRELGTLPESTTYVERLRRNLLALTEDVVVGSAGRPIPRETAHKIAQTYVAVLLDDANTARYGGEGPDLVAAAEIMALAVERCGEPL